MNGKSRLVVDQCIWIRGANDAQPILHPLKAALSERGVPTLVLNGPGDTEGIERIRQVVWNTDTHVILDALMPGELARLRPVFNERKNFSISFLDWWLSPFWFTENAEYQFYRFYNGIAVRRGMCRFVEADRRAPLIDLPAQFGRFAMICVAARLPALAAAPWLELQRRRDKQLEKVPLERMFYFPNVITAAQVPLPPEAAEYDFSNVSSTDGYWLLRDPHTSAWLNFANLYCDRKRINDLVQECSRGVHRVFDLRRSPRLNWDAYCRVIRQSRYTIATGGLHKAGLSKYLESACLGTPMIGEDLPFEFPWLSECLIPVDTLHVTAARLKEQLTEALARHGQMRENCLKARETILKLYDPHRVLDLLQAQADGQPLPPGYLKAEGRSDAV
jgi:hypothetical protein